MNSSDWQTSCKTIQEATLHLLKTAKFSDVVFLVGETKFEIHAHKLILMARSPVFEVMFERWETEKKCSIEIPEVTYKSFQSFLAYLYSNEFIVTGGEAAEVLYLAHKYGSNDLGKLCSDLLKSAIQIGNVIHIHQVASRLDQVALRTQAMDFILKHGWLVFQDIGFLGIDFETLSTILKNDKLIVDELTVFQSVMRWAEHKCKVEKLETTVKNKRNVLKNILNLIRFPLMRTEDFTDEVVRKNKGILTDTETIAIYMDLSTVSSPNKNDLPTIPFSRVRRRSPDTYRVKPYNTPNLDSDDLNCRQDYDHELIGDNFRCVSTLVFSSSENIYLSGIELQGFPDCLTLPEFASTSEFVVSIKPVKGSDVPLPMSIARVTSEQMKKLLIPSSIKIEFDSEVPILNGDQYEATLTFIGGVDRSGRANSSYRRGQLTKSSKVICGSNYTTLSFFSETTQCGAQTGLGYSNLYDLLYHSSPICLSSGQIKAIYFTI